MTASFTSSGLTRYLLVLIIPSLRDEREVPIVILDDQVPGPYRDRFLPIHPAKRSEAQLRPGRIAPIPERHEWPDMDQLARFAFGAVRSHHMDIGERGHQCDRPRASYPPHEEGRKTDSRGGQENR